MSAVKIGWGQRQNGQLIHITEAERGKKCNCTCPDCDTQLIARQGEVTAWHFAHAQPVECYGESILHKVAKQIIIDIAGTSKAFLLPSIEKEITTYDLMGKAYSSTWQFPEKNIQIERANEEVRFDNGQITDVFVPTSSHESTLALEIFVTHKKSEIDIQKFSEIKQDVIEIDLSIADALADRSTLEELVLQKSERYWLFNQEESKQQERHNEKVDRLNQDYCDEMMALVIPAVKTCQLNQLKFIWPQLAKKVSKKGLFGEFIFGEAIQTPKITKLNTNNSYSVTEYGCLTGAIVENRTKINVCFTLLDTKLPPVGKNIPLLVFEYDSGKKQFYLSWFHIHKWKKRVTELAEQDLETNLEAQKSQHSNQVSYAKNFSIKSDLEKIKFLANELSLPPLYNAGQYLDHWNTTRHVWKALVWKYKVTKKLGAKINVQNISEDYWLAQLLNWPDTEDAQKKRSKNIWYWFSKDLQQSGIIEHTGRMFFNVARSIPKNFVPWAE